MDKMGGRVGGWVNGSMAGWVDENMLGWMIGWIEMLSDRLGLVSQRLVNGAHAYRPTHRQQNANDSNTTSEQTDRDLSRKQSNEDGEETKHGGVMGIHRSEVDKLWSACGAAVSVSCCVQITHKCMIDAEIRRS
eukprot:3941284-Rhodomonas_salina.8